jgi:predicted permease
LRLWRRLSCLFRQRQVDAELAEELEFHRQMKEVELKQAGVRDAGRASRRALGSVTLAREDVRAVWVWRWLDDLWRDVAYAVRALSRSRGFTAVALLSLGVGIGANSGMFALVDGLLLRPMYERSDEVVGVYSRGTGPAGGYRAFSYPNYQDLREGTTAIFADLAAFSTDLVGLDLGDGARRTLASGVTANYFQIFDRPLAFGRPFTPEEERLGADIRVAIISYPLWEQRGADPGIIGQSVRVNGETFTVIGVTARGFTGTAIPGPDVWLPLGSHETIRTAAGSAVPPLGARDAHELGVVGRLQAGVSVEAVSPALVTVGRRLEQAFPAVNAGYTLEIRAPSRLVFLPGPRGGAMTASLALLLMIMPAIVLLVTCLNLANLLLARSHLRRRELAIRSSLGGGRGRLVRQLLTEGLLLAIAGGAVGLLLSTWATDALLASIRPVLTARATALSLPELDLDWRVLVATMAFSLMASLVFGAWPAWALTGRTIVTDLKRQAGAAERQPGGIRIGNALVVGHVALSLPLLASGGLFLMSATAAATADPGFPLERGLLAEIDPSLTGYDEARARQLHLALLDRVRAVPGIEAATIGSTFPFTTVGDSRVVAPAGVAGAQTPSVDARFAVVADDYARTLGLQLLGGRDFSEAELASRSSERVAIVADALAERLWPGENPIGRLIQFLDAPGPDGEQPIRVVGIVPAVNHSLGNPRPFPHVYVPLGQHYESAMTLQFRVADEGAERAMLTTVARLIRSVDERVPILRLQTWREHLDSNIELWLYRAGARVLSAFGGIALLLTVIGSYGVKSYLVSQRTREFGIRIAIGAHPRALLWQVMREGGLTTAVGIGFGLMLALGAGRILQSILYGVNGVEPVVLMTAPMILLASSLFASYVPARRATRVDPMVALRCE